MIKEFKNEYWWLSNFSPCEIQFNGMLFSSVEHAYMSAKSDDLDWKKFCSDSNNSPGKVKRKSKNIVLKDDWESTKIEVMRKLLKIKFSQNPYKQLLLNTENQVIQEGNRWGDTFWGVDLKTNVGDNNLGLLIMEIREELKEEKPKEKLHRTMCKSAIASIRRLLRLH
ncbi:MAG: NADAR family protein [Cytophagales bacterium]|nr:NADAR family protein [Cytophagales bacterium]